MAKKKINLELCSHTIILPTYSPVMICLTKAIAESACRAYYGKDWKDKGIRIEPTTKEHYTIFQEEDA